MNLIGVTQRPALVSTTFRGNIADAFIFPLAWANDKQAILQMIGQRYKVELENLPNYRCLYWRDGQVTKRANK